MALEFPWRPSYLATLHRKLKFCYHLVDRHISHNYNCLTGNDDY